MRLRLILALVSAWLLTPTPAAALPVALVALYTGIESYALAWVATFVINAAITTGLSWAANKLFGPKLPNSAAAAADRQASVTNLSIGEVSRELVIGECASGGSLLGAFNYGGTYQTDWAVRVVALADHRCDSLVGFYVDDTFVTFTGDGAVDGYNGQLLVYWRDGRAGQLFPSDLLASWQGSLQAAAAPTSTACYTGMAYVVVAVKADAADATTPIFSGAIPQMLFRLRGKRCYDPRKDSTVGGSGAHRWEDPTTWEWTRNAAVCRYNWVRGVYALDQVDQPGQLLVGRGLSTYEAPPQNVFAYANLCDELVDNGAGGTEPRYFTDGVIRAQDTYLSVEQLFEAAMAGQIIQPQGGIEVEPGQAKTPIFVITDDDLVMGAAVTFNAFGSDADRVNTVTPHYIEPTQKWQDTAAPVQRDLDMVALDGPRVFDLPLSLVTRSTQAQRCGSIYLQSKLLERTASIVVPPHDGGSQCFAEGEDGDWIQWTSARHTAGLPVVYRITSYGQDQSWQGAWALQETSFDVFGFGGSPLPASGGFSATTPPGALELSGVTAFAIDKEGSTGAIVPAIRVTWAAPVDAGVLQIRAEVRKVGETQAAPTTTTAVNDGTMDVTNGVGGDMAMEVRLIPLGAPGRPVVPSSWIGVSTGSMVVGSVATIGGMTVADFLAAAAATSAQGDQLTQAVLQLAAQAITERNAMITQTFHNGKQVRKIVVDDGEDFTDGDYSVTHRLQLLGLVVDAGGAFQFNDTTLMVSPTQTWADYKTAVTASFSSTNASISSEAISRAGADSALASSLSSVSTTVAGHTASITTLQTSLNGLSAEYMLVVDSGTHVASIQAYAGGSLSSLVFTATQIGFTDGTTNVFPLAISGGVVHASNFEADQVKAGSIVTNSLVGGAVTNVTWDEQAYGSILTASAAQIFSTAHTTTIGSAPHVINLNASVANGTGDVGVLLSIKRDGTLIATRSFFVQGSFTVTGSFMVFDQPSSGAHTYTIEANKTSGSGSNGNLTVSNMTITELKK